MTKIEFLNLSVRLFKDKDLRNNLKEIDDHFRQSITKPWPLGVNTYANELGLTVEEFKCILRLRGYKTILYSRNGTTELRFKPY